MALLIAFYARADWRAGASWGSRWLTDIVPLLGWMLAPVVASLGRAGRITFALLVAVAIAIETIGAFWYTGASEDAIYAVDPAAFEMSGAWKLANAPFVAELSHQRAPGDLLIEVRGTIDRLNGDARRLPVVTRGVPLVAEGWAAAAGHAPSAVLLCVDNRPLAGITTFTERADVRAMLHTVGPIGWSAAVPTDEIGAGRHVLQALARAGGEGSRLVPIGQRSFTVVPTGTGTESPDRSAPTEAPVP